MYNQSLALSFQGNESRKPATKYIQHETLLSPISYCGCLVVKIS